MTEERIYELASLALSRKWNDAYDLARKKSLKASFYKKKLLGIVQNMNILMSYH